mmetsp:Transcript_7084/g.23481  ORF Transcript_7084/g.23481 Transcript_7084/m.23481 type:complete len:201 (-) Transcript_7084:1550-2152(-)
MLSRSALSCARSSATRDERPCVPRAPETRRWSTASSAARSNGSGSTSATTSCTSCDLILSSSGVSTARDGEAFTSISHGLSFRSTRMSNPRSSKAFGRCGMASSTAKRLRRMTSVMRAHSSFESIPRCARRSSKARSSEHLHPPSSSSEPSSSAVLCGAVCVVSSAVFWIEELVRWINLFPISVSLTLYFCVHTRANPSE